MKSIPNLAAATMLLLGLNACRTIKLINAQEITTKDSCQPIEVINNQPLIHVSIEGKDQVMLLDLGATVSTLFDTSVLSGYSMRRKATLGRARGAGKGRLKVAHVPVSVTNNLHTSGNKMITIVENKGGFGRGRCTESSKFVGLYGKDFFDAHENVPYLLDFEHAQVCNLTQDQLKAAIDNGYAEIKSKFGTLMHNYIVINGQEYSFAFDTGFSGSFNIPYKPSLPFLNEPHKQIEGYVNSTLTGTVNGKERYYEHKKISFGGQEYITVIGCSETVKAQNVGVGFMKGFNWIIDPKHKKIYVKKISAAQDEVKKNTQPFYARIVEDKLYVRARQAGLTDYNIGDEIVSVDGREVTTGNICDLLAMLNKSDSWKALQIKTKPAGSVR